MRSYRDSYDKTWIDTSKSLDVKVYLKPWNSETIHEAYNTKLPVTIENISNDGWNTIAIASQVPISTKQKIIAECVKEPYYNQYEKEMIDVSKVKTLFNYVWGGNGSVIQKSNEAYLNGTQADGLEKDIAITLSDDKALTYFQWQPSNTCKSLRLQAGRYSGENLYSANPSATVNQVDIKKWNAKEWNGKNLCDKNLPCTIYAPSTDSYYLIKIKTEANAIQSGELSVICQ